MLVMLELWSINLNLKLINKIGIIMNKLSKYQLNSLNKIITRISNKKIKLHLIFNS